MNSFYVRLLSNMVKCGVADYQTPKHMAQSRVKYGKVGYVQTIQTSVIEKT